MNHTKPYPIPAYVVILVCITILLIPLSYAIPTGPTVSVLGNSTSSGSGGSIINSSVNGSTPGGYIFTTNLDNLQQNNRWKAYVGNVTGTLTLDDASDNTVFSWSLSTVTGEVYATRSSGDVNWTGINCTWIYEGSASAAASDRSAEEAENTALSHTTTDDNITSTFSVTNHSSLTIGSVVIGKNQCWSLNTYQNDGAQSFEDSDDANFTQVILYDGAPSSTDGNIVYVTEMEEDITGYRSDSTYDFQIILPENGGVGFSSSTAYYFYVELT